MRTRTGFSFLACLSDLSTKSVDKSVGKACPRCQGLDPSGPLSRCSPFEQRGSFHRAGKRATKTGAIRHFVPPRRGQARSMQSSSRRRSASRHEDAGQLVTALRGAVTWTAPLIHSSSRAGQNEDHPIRHASRGPLGVIHG